MLRINGATCGSCGSQVVLVLEAAAGKKARMYVESVDMGKLTSRASRVACGPGTHQVEFDLNELGITGRK